MHRLQKVIANAGICSRRKAEVLIQEGKVSVNGAICTVLGTKVDPVKDDISVFGRAIGGRANLVYYLFHKPKNVVSTLSDPQDRPCLFDFLRGIKARVYPVGRLDFASEGLLLLTNDGRLTQKIMHPSGGIEKKYHVTVGEKPSDRQIRMLKSGTEVEGKLVKPVSIRMLKYSEDIIEFILSDGRKHEVRVLCEAAGLLVRRLVRVSIGGLMLKGILPGKLKKIPYQVVQSSLRTH